MIRLALKELASRRTATLLTAAALLTATMSFVVLAGTSKTTQAALNGDIGTAWETPYDLLVRPADSQTDLEETEGLIRPNYVSGLLGGITRAQLSAVRSTPGVSVAAPLAMVGFVQWPSAYLKDLPPRGSEPTTVYRITASTDGDAGLSHYPIERRYVVVSTKGDLIFDPLGGTLELPGAEPLDCSYPVNCFASRVCGFGGGCEPGAFPSTSDARYYLPLLQPIVIAGIDPVAEANVAGLDGCVTSGRYLSSDDHPIASPSDADPPFESIPVLVSTHSFTDQVLSVRVERAKDMGPANRSGSPRRIRSWAPVSETSIDLSSLYLRYLPSVHDYLDPWPIWSAGDVSYATPPSDRGQPPLTPGTGTTPTPPLRVLHHPPDPSVYAGEATSGEVGIVDQLLVPPEARDPWFRQVTEHQDLYDPQPGSNYRFKLWDAVGQYDPTCLPGFNSLAGGTLETYSIPEVRLETGERLGPTRSMSGYVNSPPLLLTTMDGAAWLADPKRYRGESGTAFISSIRVRVSGTELPGDASEARLERVAAQIHRATGLQIDIAKGSSTRTERVILPAGRFGRPVLTLEEPWWAKGVAIRFINAVREQDVALFALVLVAAAVLVGESAFVSVRRRRSEFGVLRALGWPASRIALLVETEMLLLGLLVGGCGAALALVLRSTLLHPLSLGLVILSLALALIVAAVAGLVPALSAARGSAMSVIRGWDHIHRSRPPRFTFSLGIRALRRERRLETLLGIGAVALGASLLGGVVLAAEAFRNRLDTTTLGAFLGSQVHSFHVAIAVMALVFGAIIAGQIVVLGYIEREPEFGVMRAMGWPRSSVLSVLVAQGLAIGIAGGIVGGAAVFFGGQLAGEPGGAALRGALVGMLAAALATSLAVAGPMILAHRASPSRALHGE